MPRRHRASTYAAKRCTGLDYVVAAIAGSARMRGRAGVDVMVYGLILILVISFLPHGLMGWARRRRRAAA